jgi:dipeptidyl aminopeptidase
VAAQSALAFVAPVDGWSILHSYFLAAKPSTERHLYSARIPDLAEIDDHVPEVTALTDTTKPSYYSVSFSPEAGYYVLGYQGPNIPWQKLFSANDTSE